MSHPREDEISVLLPLLWECWLRARRADNFAAVAFALLADLTPRQRLLLTTFAADVTQIEQDLAAQQEPPP